MVELGDPQSFKRALADRVEEIRDDQLEAMIDVAIREGNKVLTEQAPPEGASLDEWNTQPIADSVRKVKTADGWEAIWTHPHADKLEVGVRPHEIEGNPVLRWVDRETGEEIYAVKVQHPGVPALGFIREGFRRALRAMQDVDFD